LAVCSITHGAIFCAPASPSDVGCAGESWTPLSSTRWPTASEEATAATSATTAATRNNEQKIRRQDDDVNVKCEFVIIELPMRYCLMGCERWRDDAFTPRRRNVSMEIESQHHFGRQTAGLWECVRVALSVLTDRSPLFDTWKLSGTSSDWSRMNTPVTNPDRALLSDHGTERCCSRLAVSRGVAVRCRRARRHSAVATCFASCTIDAFLNSLKAMRRRVAFLKRGALNLDEVSTPGAPYRLLCRAAPFP